MTPNRFLLVPLLTTGVLFSTAAGAQPDFDHDWPVRNAWAELLAAGCNLSEVPMWTPIETLAIRNVPFAIAGHQITNADVRHLFEQDGGWYGPSITEPVPLSREATVCVRRLERHEQRLRSRFRVPPEMAARMTRDHALFRMLRQWSQTPRSPYSRVRFTVDETGTWMMNSRYSDCQDTPENIAEGFECGGSCPVDEPCLPIAAG